MKGETLSDVQIRVETGDVYEDTGDTVDDGNTVYYEINHCTPKGVEISIYELHGDASDRSEELEVYDGYLAWDNFTERVGDDLEYIDLSIGLLVY